MKITDELYQSIKADFLTVVATRVHPARPETVLGRAFDVLGAISFDRAYSDSHPAFQAGRVRVLAYDARPFCFYYANNCDDTHVCTALKKLAAELPEHFEGCLK